MGFSSKNWYQSWYQAFVQKYQYRYQYRIFQLSSISISIGIRLAAKDSISIVSVSKIQTCLVSVSYRYRKKWYRRSLPHTVNMTVRQSVAFLSFDRSICTFHCLPEQSPIVKYVKRILMFDLLLSWQASLEKQLRKMAAKLAFVTALRNVVNHV